MLLREIIDVFISIITKHITVLYVKNTQGFNDKSGYMYTDHFSLNDLTLAVGLSPN
jgi:hypothetical protein